MMCLCPSQRCFVRDLWGPNAHPQEFEGVFGAENVILGLHLGYG